MSKREPRYRILRVSTELLASMFGDGTRASEPEEPIADLEIVGVREGPPFLPGAIEFVVWSSHFDIISDNEATPVWTPSYRRAAVAGVA